MAWVLARQFLVERLAPLILDRVNLSAAAALCVVYPAGVVFFAVRPAVDRGG